MGATLSALPDEPALGPRGSLSHSIAQPSNQSEGDLFVKPTATQPTTSRFRKTAYWTPYEEMMTAYLAACSTELRVGTLHSSFYCNEAYQERVLEATRNPALAAEETQRHKLLQRFRANVEQTVEGLFRELMEPRTGVSASRLQSAAKRPSKGRVLDGVFYWEWGNPLDGQTIGNHERRACQALLDLGVEGLCVPMTTSVSIADCCVTAIALVPIEAFRSVQRPGTAVRLHFQNATPMALSEEADSICTEVSLLLGISGVSCRSCEVHRGHDGRVYFVGNADWLPAVAVAKVTDPTFKRSTFQSISHERSTNSFRHATVCWGTPCVLMRAMAPTPATADFTGYEQLLIGEAMPEAITYLRENDLGDRVFPYLRRCGISTRFLPVVLEGVLGSLSLKTIGALQMRIFIKSLRDVMGQEFRKALQLSAFSSAENLNKNFINIAQTVVDFVFGLPEVPPTTHAVEEDRRRSAAMIESSGPNSIEMLIESPPSVFDVKDPVRILMTIVLPACCRRYVMPVNLQLRLSGIVMGSDVKRRVFHELCRQCGLQVLRGTIQGFVAAVKKFPIPDVLSRETVDAVLARRATFDRPSFSTPLIYRATMLDLIAKLREGHLRASDTPSDANSMLPSLQQSTTASQHQQPQELLSQQLFNEEDGSLNPMSLGLRQHIPEEFVTRLEGCIAATTSFKPYNIHLKRRLGLFWLQQGDLARASSLLRAYSYAAQSLDSKGYKDIEIITHALIRLARCVPNEEQLLESIYSWQPRKWLDPPLFMRRAFFQLDLTMLTHAVGSRAVEDGRVDGEVALKCLRRALKTMESSAAGHPDDARLANDIAVEFINAQRHVILRNGRVSSVHQLCVSTAEQLLTLAIQQYGHFVGIHHQDTLTAMTSLSLLYVWNEEAEKAIRVAKEVVTLAATAHAPPVTLAMNVSGGSGAQPQQQGKGGSSAATTNANRTGDATMGNALVHLARVLERFNKLREACQALERAVAALTEALGRVAAPTLAAAKKLAKLQRKYQGVAARRIQKFLAAIVACRRAQTLVAHLRVLRRFEAEEERARLSVGLEWRRAFVEIAKSSAGLIRMPPPESVCNIGALVVMQDAESLRRRALETAYVWLLRDIVPDTIDIGDDELFALWLSRSQLPPSDDLMDRSSADARNSSITTSSLPPMTRRRSKRRGTKTGAKGLGSSATPAVGAKVKLSRPSTLEQIARRHGTTVQQLRLVNPEYNHCFDIHIVPKGAVVNLPPSATANIGSTFNTIRKLSERYGVSAAILRRFNSVLTDVADDDAELDEGVCVYIPSSSEVDEFNAGNASPSPPRSTTSPGTQRSMRSSSDSPCAPAPAGMDLSATPTRDELERQLRACSAEPLGGEPLGAMPTSNSTTTPPAALLSSGAANSESNLGSRRGSGEGANTGNPRLFRPSLSAGQLLATSATNNPANGGSFVGSSYSVGVGSDEGQLVPMRTTGSASDILSGSAFVSTSVRASITVMVKHTDEAVSDDVVVGADPPAAASPPPARQKTGGEKPLPIEGRQRGTRGSASVAEDDEGGFYESIVVVQPSGSFGSDESDIFSTGGGSGERAVATAECPSAHSSLAQLETEEASARCLVDAQEAMERVDTREDMQRRTLKLAAWVFLQAVKQSMLLQLHSEVLGRNTIGNEEAAAREELKAAIASTAPRAPGQLLAEIEALLREERIERVSIEAAEALARASRSRGAGGSGGSGGSTNSGGSSSPINALRRAISGLKPAPARPDSASSTASSSSNPSSGPISRQNSLALRSPNARLMPHQVPTAPAPHTLDYSTLGSGIYDPIVPHPPQLGSGQSSSSATSFSRRGLTSGGGPSSPSLTFASSTNGTAGGGALWSKVDASVVKHMTQRMSERATPQLSVATGGANGSTTARSIVPSSGSSSTLAALPEPPSTARVGSTTISSSSSLPPISSSHLRH